MSFPLWRTAGFGVSVAALAAVFTFAINSGPQAAPNAVLTPETFQSAVSGARSGDVLRLGPGWYGDLAIRGKTFEAPLRLVAADPANPPVFNTIAVRATQGVSMEGLTIASRPTAATVENSPVLNLEACGRVTFTGGRISGGVAVNGVPEDSPTLDRTGNVTGWPTGRIVVSKCNDVTIENTEIKSLGRGIVLNEATGLVVRGNDIHGLRRTAILGVGRDVLIEKNRIHDFRPWRFGQTPVGDHADFIAFWVPPKLAPLNRIRVVGNTLDAGSGTPVLGMWFVDYDDLEVRDNILIGTDHQGIMTTNAKRPVITNNVLNGRALIILREGTVDAVVTDNLTNQVWDKNNGKTNNRIERNRPAKGKPKAKPST